MLKTCVQLEIFSCNFVVNPLQILDEGANFPFTDAAAQPKSVLATELQNFQQTKSLYSMANWAYAQKVG